MLPIDRARLSNLERAIFLVTTVRDSLDPGAAVCDSCGLKHYENKTLHFTKEGLTGTINKLTRLRGTLVAEFANQAAAK